MLVANGNLFARVFVLYSQALAAQFNERGVNPPLNPDFS
jgi:hypothetical protein